MKLDTVWNFCDGDVERFRASAENRGYTEDEIETYLECGGELLEAHEYD